MSSIIFEKMQLFLGFIVLVVLNGGIQPKHTDQQQIYILIDGGQVQIQQKQTAANDSQGQRFLHIDHSFCNIIIQKGRKVNK